MPICGCHGHYEPSTTTSKFVCESLKHRPRSFCGKQESVRRGVVLSSEGNGGTNAAAQQETSGHKPEVHQLTGIGRLDSDAWFPL